MFRDWKIRTKLLFGFAILVLIFIINTVLIFSFTRSMVRELRELETQGFARLDIIIEMKNIITRLSKNFTEATFLTKDMDVFRKKVKILNDKFLILHSELVELIGDNIALSESVHFVEELFQQYKVAANRLLDVFEDRTLTESRWKTIHALESVTLDLDEAIYDLYTEEISEFSVSLGAIDTLARKAEKEAVLIAVLVLCASIVITFLLSRMIVKSLDFLIKGTREVAKGDFDLRVKIDSKDEFGQLANSFNKMTENLKSITVSRDMLSREVEERMKAEIKLKVQKSFIDRVINSLNYPFYVIDTEYKVMMVNKVAAAKGVRVGGYCYEYTHHRDSPCSGEHKCPLRDVLSTHNSVKMEHIHTSSNGQRRIVEVYGVPIFNSYGDVVQVIEYSIDITERKKAEQDMLNYTRQIEEINKELDDFTYIVSHDLKEPLRSINAFSNFLEEDYKDKFDPEAKEYLRRIDANTTRMQNLIEDLLQISRIGRKKNPFEEVSIEWMLEEVKVRLQYSIKEKEAQILTKNKLPVIFCDRIRMLEVFANLISNAVKFADKKPAVIEIGFSVKGIFYEFYVKDNGPGIEKEYFEKIFQIFQRLGRREEHEGTGAGLTIVKKIVQMHGGRIWVESELGQGTTFYFTIPRNKEHMISKKKIGEILVNKKLVTEEQVQQALDEQDENI